MNSILFLLFATFLLVIAGRIYLDRTAQHLEEDKKAALTTITRKYKIIRYIITLLIIAAMLFNVFLDWLVPINKILLVAGVAITGISIDKLLQFRQLKYHNFPAFYIRAFLLVALAQIAGILLIVVWTFYTLKENM